MRAGRAGGLGRGAGQYSRRDLVRRSRRRPIGPLPRARSCRRRWTSISAASPACRSSRAPRSPNTMPRPAATRSMPAAAARCARRRELATVLGIAPDELRVLSHDVGGNFGTRNRVFVEFGLVLWAAKKLGRPVKYTATRSEAFLSDYQGRDLVTKVELALDADGRFLAMRATNISNVGARCVSLSPLGKGAGADPRLLRHSGRDAARASPSSPTPCRPGLSQLRPAGSDLRDRAADRHRRARARLRPHRAAAQQSRAPASDMPYRNAVGMIYDSGRYEENMDWAMAIADWKGFPARRREAEAARQAARPRACELRRILDRRAARTGAHHGAAATGSGRCGHRHAAERAGARNELCPGGLRPARTCRSRASRIILGDTDVVQRRRRLAFRPLDAPCRDRVRQGRRRR